MTEIAIRRVYEAPGADDGYRVLVDRLWPRGMSHERAHLDAWLKQVAPSPALRTWWHHDPDTAVEFAARYRAELDENPAGAELLATVREHPRVTLVYAARDPKVNHALVLRDWLRERLADAAGTATDAQPATRALWPAPLTSRVRPAADGAASRAGASRGESPHSAPGASGLL